MGKNRIPKPGEIYLHFKKGIYQIITVAVHTETEEAMVVYQALYGDFKTYVRPLTSFLSEVDHEKYPEVKQKYRFELQGLNYLTVTERGLVRKQDTTPVKVSVDEPGDAEMEEGTVNPVLLQFLEAESYYKKLEVITSNRKHMNDRLVNDIAVSLDCAVDDGPLDQRIQGLISCLQALCRFEDKRLR